jgi:two-component sensor histidine kinase
MMNTQHAFTSTHRAPLPSSTLAEMQDARAHLNRLCERIRTVAAGDVEVTFAGDTCHVESERCWRLAMIVRELVEKALRHSFAKRGIVTVELNAKRSVVECRITDNACSRASNDNGPAMNLVYAQTGTLRGRLARKSDAGGTTWIVTIPR